MKKLFIISCVIFLSLNVSAQFVTLQDTAFRDWIDVNIPGAIVNGLLDTQHPGVVNRTAINIQGGYDFYNLSGLEFFTNLKYLTCTHVSLDVYPFMPWFVEGLDFSNNNLTGTFYIRSSFIYVNISNNDFTAVDGTVFSILALQDFYASYNLIHTVSFPSYCIFFRCLFLSNNQLTKFNVIPSSVEYLDLESNSLDSIGSFPSNLKVLWADNNQLAQLPTFPQSLYQLECSNNNLTSLPALPLLGFLDCRNNQLDCLPLLPSTISGLRYSGNNLNCLPNYPLNYNASSSDPLIAICDTSSVCPNYVDLFFQNSIGRINNKCNSDATGKLTVSTQGNYPPFIYQWSNGSTTNQIDSLAAAIYSVTVTDDAGNYKTLIKEITEPAVLTVTTAPVVNGNIDQTIAGGTMPYSYLWSSGETIEDLTNKPFGTYYCLVEDKNGCATLNVVVVP